MLDPIVADARSQAAELPALDAPRAEAWASDLLALLDEVDASGAGATDEGGSAAARVVAELAAEGDAGSGAALHAIAALEPGLVDGIEISGPTPAWAGSLGTSECVGAWLVRVRGAESALFHFADADGAGHVLSVDLVPAPVGELPERQAQERVGAVVVGPVELLEAATDTESGAGVDERPPAALAERVAAALEATIEPEDSAVAAGRLLVARLSPLADRPMTPPAPAADVVPDLPSRDPDDDAYAADVLARGIGSPAPVDEEAVAVAADVLRRAAAADEPLARWLAASVGPVDLDDGDLEVVVAALAATAGPARLEPLAADERDAVLALEWADWLGAALGLVRAGAGSPTEPEALVDHVNRVPEVTTSIPRDDRARIAWAFSVCTSPWRPLGLVDADGALTDLGVTLVPRFLLRAWGHPIGD